MWIKTTERYHDVILNIDLYSGICMWAISDSSYEIAATGSSTERERKIIECKSESEAKEAIDYIMKGIAYGYAVIDMSTWEPGKKHIAEQYRDENLKTLKYQCDAAYNFNTFTDNIDDRPYKTTPKKK